MALCECVCVCLGGTHFEMGGGWLMHVHIRDKGIWRERQLFLSKCLQRCKRGCEGPWHQLARLTDWKQGFIFSNLWSQHRERSVEGRRGEGVREKPWEVKWRTSSKTNSHQQMSMRDAQLTGTNGIASISIWHVLESLPLFCIHFLSFCFLSLFLACLLACIHRLY